MNTRNAIGSGNRRKTEEPTIADIFLQLSELNDKVDKILDREEYDREYYNSRFAVSENRISIVEREVNKKALIITGIKHREGEKLSGIVQNIGVQLKQDILATDIDEVYRFGREKERIKVNFLRTSVKREILQAIKKRKKLSTKEIGFEEDQQIYINEDLGAGAAEIFKEARKLKRLKLISNTWTLSGRVFYKVNPNDNPTLCSNIEQLFALNPVTVEAQQINNISQPAKKAR